MLTLCHWAELVDEKALDRVMHISKIYRLFIKETNCGLNNISAALFVTSDSSKRKKKRVALPTYSQSLPANNLLVQQELGIAVIGRGIFILQKILPTQDLTGKN